MASSKMTDTTMTDVVICQGAEGKVYSTFYLGRPAVCKVRMNKSYRVPALDEKINKHRLLQEARCIAKCKRMGISAPCVYMVDAVHNKLYMEKIEGQSLKQLLWTHYQATGTYTGDENEKIAQKVGAAIALMHDAEIVHGDLTTSNIMVRPEDTPDQVVLIDFGLGAMKPTAEDKAVDLYVLERAFISTHNGSELFVERILEHYRFNSKKGTQVLLKLDQVRQRGRKRDMLG